MHKLLSKLFEKRGIQSITDLDEEERRDFEEWDKILSKEDLTVKDIVDFCHSQADYIEGKWQDLDIENSKKAQLIPYHTVYKLLVAVIEAPQSAREAKEKELIDMTK